MAKTVKLKVVLKTKTKTKLRNKQTKTSAVSEKSTTIKWRVAETITQFGTSLHISHIKGNKETWIKK